MRWWIKYARCVQARPKPPSAIERCYRLIDINYPESTVIVWRSLWNTITLTGDS
jgi:hypothetical protein